MQHREQPGMAPEGQRDWLKAAIEASGDLLYEWDVAGDAMRWTGPATALFGRNVPRCGREFTARIQTSDREERTQALQAHLSGQGLYDCEYRVYDDHGRVHRVHDRGAVSRSPSGEPARLSGRLSVVIERALSGRGRDASTSCDELTGLPTREILRDRLCSAIDAGLAQERSGAFLVVGIDQLGLINQAYGGRAGDTVLIEVARRITEAADEGVLIGRLGGDRFGVLLSQAVDAQVEAMAARLREGVQMHPVKVGRNAVHASVRIGAAAFPGHGREALDIIAMAEEALRQAKRGGSALQLYEASEARLKNIRASLDIGRAVRKALAEGRLSFVFQSIVSAGQRSPRYAECLIRLLGCEGEAIAAGYFIPTVEELGLVTEVDRRALELVVQELEAYSSARLSMNVSSLTVADPSWRDSLRALVGSRPDIAERLVIELTETMALRSFEESIAFVRAVRSLGCKVAIDDFGAGFSTFRHLKALTVDAVKIDGSFVSDIRHSPRSRLFVRNLVDLARTYNLSTVAECVEDEATAAILAEEGVDCLQGYLFGKPTPDPIWRRPCEKPRAEEPQPYPRLVYSAG
jgi:diguanylate cyclase (GGDEF)-like protein